MISERVLREIRDAVSGCAQGDCKYPDPHRPPVDPLRVARPALCLGWHGVLHLEGGEHVVRYRRCERHDRWWTSERARVRAQRAAERATHKPPRVRDPHDDDA